MAHGRFDDPLAIGDNGESVEVCGPARWDGDQNNDGPAQSLTIHQVDIKQGGTKAGVDLNQQFQRPQPEWMGGDLSVDGSGSFENGHAQADADVDVVLETGQTIHEHWHQQVELSTEGDGSD